MDTAEKLKSNSLTPKKMWVVSPLVDSLVIVIMPLLIVGTILHYAAVAKPREVPLPASCTLVGPALK